MAPAVQGRRSCRTSLRNALGVQIELTAFAQLEGFVVQCQHAAARGLHALEVLPAVDAMQSEHLVKCLVAGFFAEQALKRLQETAEYSCEAGLIAHLLPEILDQLGYFRVGGRCRSTRRRRFGRWLRVLDRCRGWRLRALFAF